MSLLKKLQQKPEAVRKRYVIGVAFITTLLIIVVWIPTLGTKFRQNPQDNETSEAPSPLDSFTGTVRSLFSGFSYEAEQVKKDVEEVRVLFEEFEEAEQATTSEEYATTTSSTTEE